MVRTNPVPPLRASNRPTPLEGSAKRVRSVGRIWFFSRTHLGPFSFHKRGPSFSGPTPPPRQTQSRALAFPDALTQPHTDPVTCPLSVNGREPHTSTNTVGGWRIGCKRYFESLTLDFSEKNSVVIQKWIKLHNFFGGFKFYWNSIEFTAILKLSETEDMVNTKINNFGFQRTPNKVDCWKINRSILKTH